MPMFDFVCTACGNKFEELVFGDESPACPQCSAPSERQMCVPSPLKTGAFPYTPGPVRPMGKGMPTCAAGSCSSGACGTGSTGGSS